MKPLTNGNIETGGKRSLKSQNFGYSLYRDSIAQAFKAST